jgi:predicted Ser/Thr protein kinase
MSAMKICPQCNTEYELDQRFCPKDGTTLKMQGGQTGDLLGQIIADRYHVLKKLGEGGMGTVYLAEHVKMGRKSAVKVMNPGMVADADAISRFNREAQNASRINHANVAAVYDFGETSDGQTYLAMEFIEGPALTKVIEDAGALPPLRAAEITRQASEALSVAHDMGIVHRDLKPDNIMLAKGREGVDIVKVVDFGIAKAAAEEGQKVTKTGMVVGTPEYMSPEQLSGDKLDGRSDTYSLALVAFNMLTGKLPFPAETAQESMIARLVEQPKQLAEMKPDTAWTADVQTVMNKALARDAADRYQTAAEFGRDLFNAVKAMPSHDELTSAHTAVIARRSKPVDAKTVVGGAKKPAPVPATRVGAATPVSEAAVQAPAKSKMPMFAGIGVAVVVIGVGGLFAKNMLGAKGGADTTTFNSAVTTPPNAPRVDLSPRFASIDSMVDLLGGATAETATRGLAQLDSLTTLAVADTDKVNVVFLRAKGHLTLSADSKSEADSKRHLDLGCALLKDNEGLASRTGFGKRFEGFLKADPAKPNLKALCQ